MGALLPHMGSFLSQYYASGRQGHMFYICCTEKAIDLTNRSTLLSRVRQDVLCLEKHVWNNNRENHQLHPDHLPAEKAVAFCLIVRQPILHLAINH